MLFNIASLVAVALAAATATSSVEAKPTSNGNCHFDNLLVFGDSYSDIGNVYKLSNKAWPLKTYDHGRFSNGPVWSEHVASHKHLKLKTYAFGGATTDSAFVQGYSGAASDLAVPGFIQQIDQYYSPKPIPKKDLASSLFVVDFQGNDYFFNPAASPTAVVANIEKGIEKLVQLGAQNILLVENFDYGTIPYFGGNATISGPFSQAAKAQLVAYKDLEKRLAKKYGRPSDAKHPFRGACHKDNKTKVTFGYYKLNEFFNHIREPKVLKRLGITDVAHGCVSNDYKTVCKDAGKHLFWDAFHPTAKIHKALGDAITELI
ncbi:carbohydrate esterase family 16 protein [Linnemannia elongata AG-77]|uniref:Carbohydrate esterase family 16 protein n=1 Tax=Linnemannia elongata AG-77 TaxID=1314771 RepID=A0A197K3Y5_9FUNG|nr:carbohydrate esterase family 16 protein [Linnemannia elongata AG-77]